MLVVLCTLLKVYLPALYRVATSNHTRVCLHSRELLSYPTLRVHVPVCVFYVHLICLCVPKSAVAGVAPHSGLFVYNYVYVCYVHFICLCVCVYPSELLLESLHIQGCLYIIMYMCILSVYVFVCTQVSCCWSHSTFRVVCI